MGVLFSESRVRWEKAQHRDLLMTVCVVAISIRKLQRIGRFWRGWRKGRFDLRQLPLILCFLSVSLPLLFNVIVFIDWLLICSKNGLLPSGSVQYFSLAALFVNYLLLILLFKEEKKKTILPQKFLSEAVS